MLLVQCLSDADIFSDIVKYSTSYLVWRTDMPVVLYESESIDQRFQCNNITLANVVWLHNLIITYS